MAARSVASELSEEYSDDKVRRGLHQLGYVWKPPPYLLAPGPQRGKIRQIRRAVSALSRRTVLVEDETALLLLPPLRAVNRGACPDA